MKRSKYLFANHRESQEWYVYGNFYAAPAQYMIGGDTWEKWYKAIATTVVKSIQERKAIFTVGTPVGAAGWGQSIPRPFTPPYWRCLTVTCHFTNVGHHVASGRYRAGAKEREWLEAVFQHERYRVQSARCWVLSKDKGCPGRGIRITSRRSPR